MIIRSNLDARLRHVHVILHNHRESFLFTLVSLDDFSRNVCAASWKVGSRDVIGISEISVDDLRELEEEKKEGEEEEGEKRKE